MKRTLAALLAPIALSLVLSCARAPIKEEAPAPPAVEKLPVEEQEAKAAQKFEEILEIASAIDRKSVLPDMERAYLGIIEKYPDAYLTHESYWRLIVMNIEDYYPPRTEQAEKYYREFVSKYPNSPLRFAVDDTMGRFYYNNKIWGGLLELCAPYIREYITSGELGGPLFLFFYTEAKFFSGDIVEADKGYRTIIRLFPGSQEARVAGARIEDIRSGKVSNRGR